VPGQLYSEQLVVSLKSNTSQLAGSWPEGVMERPTTDLLSTMTVLNSEYFFSDLDFLHSQQVFYGAVKERLGYTNAAGKGFLYHVGAGIGSGNIPSELVD
jgi:hypothetical protein